MSNFSPDFKAALRKELNNAAEEGDCAKITRLLDCMGTEIDWAGQDKDVLYSAVLHEHIDATRLLLDRGAKIDRDGIGEEGRWPLGAAVQAAHIPMMQFLLERGARVQTGSHAKDHALRWAIPNGKMITTPGHVDAMRLLLKHGADAAANVTAALSNKSPLAVIELPLEHSKDIPDKALTTAMKCMESEYQAERRFYKDVLGSLLQHIFRPEAWQGKPSAEIDAKAKKLLESIEEINKNDYKYNSIKPESLRFFEENVQWHAKKTFHDLRRLQHESAPLKIGPSSPPHPL